jgi:hypothetical protein
VLRCVDLSEGRLRPAQHPHARGRCDHGEASQVGGRRPRVAAAPGGVEGVKATQAAEKLAAGDVYADSGMAWSTSSARHCGRTQELMATVGVRRVRLYDARHTSLDRGMTWPFLRTRRDSNP